MDEINETILYLFGAIRQLENCNFFVFREKCGFAAVAGEKQDLAVLRDLLQQAEGGCAAFVVEICQCVIQN